MASTWRRGHIGRFWDINEIKNFPYIRQPLMESEIEVWKSQGYDYVKSFSGSMYDNRNPMPSWVKRFDDLFDLNNLTYNFYKMSQLEIMPVHVDHFQTYMKLFGVEFDQVQRVLVMLDDWKPGHYLEVDGVGVVNWVAGDYFLWDSDVPHAAANIGIEDRYTLQITGTKINPDDVYKKVHYYNFPDRRPRKDSLYSPEMAVMKKLMNKTNPYMVYMYNRQINGLEKMNHDLTTVKKMNDEGLDIYLFEPLCSYLEGAEQFYPPFGTKHTMGFYSEFTYDNANDVDKNVETEKRKKLRSDELDSIVEYIDRNNLTNVNVHTCDENVEKYYLHYQDKMKLGCDDLFLKYFDLHEFQKIYEDDDQGQFTKKFICMNWRYAPHRQLIAAYLSHIEEKYLTWYFKADMHHVDMEPWYAISDWLTKDAAIFNKIVTGFNKLNELTPINLDLEVRTPTIIDHRHLKKILPSKVIYEAKTEKNGDNKDMLAKFYADIFCDIVTESRFAQPTANFSEKTYRPIFYKKPFILAAPPETLHYLKMQGFETFSDFWSEDYDAMHHHQSRIFAIFKLIDEINSKSIEELRYMYSHMLPILEHNRKLLLEKCPYRY